MMTLTASLFALTAYAAQDTSPLDCLTDGPSMACTAQISRLEGEAVDWRQWEERLEQAIRIDAPEFARIRAQNLADGVDTFFLPRTFDVAGPHEMLAILRVEIPQDPLQQLGRHLLTAELNWLDNKRLVKEDLHLHLLLKGEALMARAQHGPLDTAEVPRTAQTLAALNRTGVVRPD